MARMKEGHEGHVTCQMSLKTTPTSFSPEKLTKTSNLEVPPVPVTITTWIFTWVVGNTYNTSFVSVTGWGVDFQHVILPL